MDTLKCTVSSTCKGMRHSFLRGWKGRRAVLRHSVSPHPKKTQMWKTMNICFIELLEIWTIFSHQHILDVQTLFVVGARSSDASYYLISCQIVGKSESPLGLVGLRVIITQAKDIPRTLPWDPIVGSVLFNSVLCNLYGNSRGIGQICRWHSQNGCVISYLTDS